jgi:hypothetical protein
LNYRYCCNLATVLNRYVAIALFAAALVTGVSPNLDFFAAHAAPISTMAWAKACGASCGRLWPMPLVMVRCSYLPENFCA